MTENKKHFIYFENSYPSWTLKYYLDPLSKENLNRFCPYISLFENAKNGMAENKKHFTRNAESVQWEGIYYQQFSSAGFFVNLHFY